MLLIESCDFEIINFSQMYCMYVCETVNPNDGVRNWSLRVKGYGVTYNIAHGTQHQMEGLMGYIVPVLRINRVPMLTQAFIKHLNNLLSEAKNGKVHQTNS